jgi:hypothetical protein
MSTPTTPTADSSSSSSSSSSSNLRSLIYETAVDGKPPTLQVLDQLLLPQEKKYIPVPNVQTAWSVIRNMQIRGTYRRSEVKRSEAKLPT